MPRFSYKSVTPAGEVVEGEMEAASRDAVVDWLRSQGHVPIRADERRARGLRLSFAARRVRPKEVVVLTRELATLLGAGLTLDRTLTILAGLAEQGPARTLMERVQERVRGGASLADALADSGGVFPDFYVGMVRAGEAGGTLEAVLTRLADTMERSQAIRDSVRSALQYPVIVLVMAGLSVAILLTAVIPEFRPLFEEAGAALPISTRIIVSASDLFRDAWWVLALAMLVVIFAIRRHNSEPAGRLRWDRWVLRTPLLGELARKVETARLARTLGTLLANGVSVLNALTMSAATLQNRAMAETIADVRGHLQKGEGLGEPLARSGVLPGLATQLIQVGEESGQLEQMLLRVADIYDEEVKRTIARLLALLVPAITIALGALVAFIVGSMLTAILSSYDLPF